jgi:hypothetical protein
MEVMLILNVFVAIIVLLIAWMFNMDNLIGWFLIALILSYFVLIALLVIGKQPSKEEIEEDRFNTRLTDI